MPEDAQITQSLVELLNEIDDPEFDKKSKSVRLKSLLTLLQNGKVPSQDDVAKILKICTELDTSCLVYEVAIISVIVKNEEITETIENDSLIASALFLLELLRTVFFTPNTVRLRSMTLQTFLSYPVRVLNNIAISHGNEILNTMNTENGTLDVELKVEMWHLIKVLDYMPMLNAKLFVKQGVNIWLSKLIPQTMTYMALDYHDNTKQVYVQYMESLIDVLVTTDYFEHKHWKNILEGICNTKKYPSIIKKLLEQGSILWHRLWIIIIKLLNGHITKNICGLGTPINSMLPVVETAFKMDAEQRIRAFQCWNKLIDNFSNETNENCIAKRIKLLLIPLTLNNAKTADIALTKFETWWHFIRKFDSKLEKFPNDVLIPFLHFVFGKSGTTKPCLTATQLSNKLKRKSVEAFVEIVGHVDDCECSLDIPKLNKKILNINLLVSNWNDWIHFLNSAFKLSSNVAIYELSTKNYMKCVLRTAVQLIASLADNNVRRDLFTEMLTMILNMLKETPENVHLYDVVVTALISALFDGSDQMKDLLKTKSEDYKPLSLITSTLVDAAMNNYYTRFTESQLIDMFKPLAFLVLHEIILNNELCIFHNLKPNDTLLKFWVAIMDNVPDMGSEISPELLLSLMEWPLIMLDSFKEVKVAAMKWYTICNLMYKKLSTTGFNKEISKHIVPKADSMNYFIICVTIGVMKQRLLNGESPRAMSSLMKKFTSSIKEYNEFEVLMPLIFDTVVLMLTVAENENVEFAKDATTCAKDLLRVIIPAIDKSANNNESTATLFIQFNNLQKAIYPLIKIKSYENYFLEIIDELSSHLTTVRKDSPILISIISILKSYIDHVDQFTKDKIKKKLGFLNGNGNLTKQTSKNIMDIAVVKEFTSPDIKKVKKAKKIEPNIVNKVVENGEEYIVVKSNWKFNPKKLTENQKEKFQRKREDIPALYQDLSQSQDEFKLSTWKTDSQDTTTTSNSNTSNSKTVTAEDSTSILKTIPSTEVVPKIMKNILQKSDQKVEDPQKNDKEILPEKVNSKTALTPTTNTKSPRLALKDRVYRNMKTLLEKSTPPKDKPDIDLRVHTENVPSTPTSKPINDSSVLNSAPPLLIADRPSRVKRKTPNDKPDIDLRVHTENVPSTPTSKPINDSSVLNSAPPLLIADRPSRVKRKTPPNDKPDIDLRVHTENIPSTPTSKPINDSSVLNSAPPLLIADRPSRVKRTPKKFNDSELFALRKRRHSQSGGLQSDCQVDLQNYKQPVDDKLEQTAESVNNVTVQNVNKVEDVVIEGVEPLNTNDDLVEKPQTENDEEITNKETLIKSSDILDSIDEVDNNKVTEVDLTALIVKKEPSQTPVISRRLVVKVVSESEPLTEPKEPVNNVVEENIVTIETDTQNDVEIDSKTDKVPVTPATKTKVVVPPKSSTKKSAKKSRIEKELAIDMVEGHPLFKVQSEKRTRKKIVENLLTPKRKSVADKLNKSKSEATPKSAKKLKKKNTNTQVSVTVEETQERNQSPEDVIQEEPPCSEDVIESSQDSTITTMSVKSTKRIAKRKPVVTLERLSIEKVFETQGLLQNQEDVVLQENKTDTENRDDSVFPQNKTVEDNDQTVLTENMDTEPMDDKHISDDVIVINDNEESPITIHSEEVLGPETQELAEAETQPNNTVDFMEFETTDFQIKDPIVPVDTDLDKTQDSLKENSKTIPEVKTNPDKTKDLLSPFKDEDQRMQDFLNNTVEISPIKVQSPDRDETPSPETSRDFVVIKLSSPVHINGEPFEKPGSPEFFTNDKISPDKRDVSPPRTEVIAANNTSPNSSLSLKKNKPQVRPGGRAAHMLGLCVPDKLNTMKMAERFEVEEAKKTSTPARRNLRILYNTVGDNTESSESEENENFLKLQRSLPAVDCSPVGPILKRKLSEIADDATVSPASKRKRVSFHDPPVSTTISVHKYIEPTGLRSPQNSAQKRLERQSRQPYSKSPKRLDNVFKLETVLSKAVESFTEIEPFINNTPEETQTSLEVTPAMEIIKTSELNDTDPICPELVNCEDPISVIAVELSSPSLKHLFVKQVEDEVKTVSDLAKMTEVDVCRLCIKAPKVKVAKKVLTDYATKQKESAQVDTVNIPDTANVDTPVNEAQIESEVNTSSVEIQTDKVAQTDMEVQTMVESVVVNSTQTEAASVTCNSAQTDESGSRSTTDVINTCLIERNDFVDKLSDVLDMTKITRISRKLPSSNLFDMLLEKQKSTDILDNVLEKECCDVTKEGQRKKELAFFTEYMSQRFDSKKDKELAFFTEYMSFLTEYMSQRFDSKKDIELAFFTEYMSQRFDRKKIMLFCSQLLQKGHDKPA